MEFDTRVFDLASSDFGTLTGERRGNAIYLQNARAGAALYGGHITLPPGRYIAKFFIDLTDMAGPGGFYDVCSDAGAKIIERKYFRLDSISKQGSISIEFLIRELTEGVELRLFNWEGSTFGIRGLTLLDLGTDSVRRRIHRCRSSSCASDERLNILYFSCHEILEYDELRIFTSLGHQVFSTGYFCQPGFPTYLRPFRPEFFQERFLATYDKGGLTKEFVELFDLVVIAHDIAAVRKVCTLGADVPIIYRSIGQSTLQSEQELNPYRDRLTIVRYSEGERAIDGFQRSDEVIKFGKFSSDYYLGWTDGEGVLTFHSGYPARSKSCIPDADAYDWLSNTADLRLHGAKNEGISVDKGIVSSEAQFELYRKCQIYFYVHSMPTSYTLNFIEAMGMGAPILAPSWNYVRKIRDQYFPEPAVLMQNRYDIPLLLNNDENLLYESIEDAAEKIQKLGADPGYRRRTSIAMRERFLEHFDADKIAEQWNALFSRLVYVEQR